MNNLKKLGLNKLGITNIQNLYRNLSAKQLVRDIINNNEGILGMKGVAMVDTGVYTGRSPNDRYIVSEPSSEEKIWWGPVNQKITESIFNTLYEKVISHYNNSINKKTYLFDGFAGADPKYSLSVRIIARKAWQALFAHNMFILPNNDELVNFNPGFTIINASEVTNNDFKKFGMNSNTFIIFHLERKIAIIGGTEYAGEMKKGIFSVLNYLLPQKNVLSMHCAANTDINGENPVIFFGLSGTGKTTLSTDSIRPLIGDDEHGWSEKGIFNFEGGCYAKVINLNRENEPEIFNAIREGALIENVVYDPLTKEIDFSDASKTENTRVSYSLDHINNSLFCSKGSSLAGHPRKIIFLTCDAYGILPPVAKLTRQQALYHFISGYTAKIAGTERGITEPIATFSPCFGGPFLMLHPMKYADLLKKKMIEHNATVYLVNTGWIGSSASSGAKRVSIAITRKIIHSIVDGEIENSQFDTTFYFNLSIPKSLGNIDKNILNPIDSWANKSDYHLTAKILVKKFKENYRKYDLGNIDILKGGPESI